MRLLRAEFHNFRLLRDLELVFAAPPDSNLTVIRAANESGKTTILSALQWALYGDDALPGTASDYRLHPIDWDASEGPRVPVTVTVDFEVSTFRRGPSGPKETKTNYRIVRAASEEVSGNSWNRSASTVRLFQLNPQGAHPVHAPEAFIADELPAELREVFFTDGDRALSFIEADVAVVTKRSRVQKAIRSLLGLGVVEKAIEHVQRAAAEVNKQARKLGGGGELAGIASRLDGLDAEIAAKDAELKDAEQQFAAFDQQLADVDRKIAAALQKGDKEQLKRELEQAASDLKRLDGRLEAATKEHSALFRGQAIALDLLAPAISPAFAILDGLRDRGKIPSTTIPVLEDRLSGGTCICGEDLRGDDENAQRRRSHVEHLIEHSRRADEIQGTVTDLYFGSKQLQGEEGVTGRFREEYRRVVENRDSLEALRNDTGKKLKAVEIQIDALPQTDVQSLRETKRHYMAQRDRFMTKQVEVQTHLGGLKREKEDLTEKRDSLLRERKKGARILAELDVSQDMVGVLRRSYDRITKEELSKVSSMMNSLFLEMIGSDPQQGAIIQRAEISREFDIVVSGPNGRMLNPDRDLNGASRRALTLSFILALTKVSEVDAPNVIDTPLGMMSGFVKRSVLHVAIRESSQLVLFLTHTEIGGCEEILDTAGARVITLTNPAHYPKMLVHDPGVRQRRVLRCNCDHRSTCSVCDRHTDAGPSSIPVAQVSHG